MFATPFTTFHTLLSIAALITGALAMMSLVNNRRLDVWTIAFFVTMIATDVTGFLFPFDKLLPSHFTGILSLVLLGIAMLAQFTFSFAGAWRWIYAVTLGPAVYLNYFVLVTQLFLKVPALHALAPNAPDNPEPPFLIVQTIVLAIFIFLIWKSVRNFRPVASVQIGLKAA
jgi:hypothetical protein